MKKVRSFDIFDTLVGRLHKEPHSTFELVERDYPFPNFCTLRQAAEARSDGSLDDIYRQLATAANLSREEAAKLRAFELEAELRNVFPIAPNVAQVQDGDILVSDTYYSAVELEQILKRIGLTQKVEIFASYQGKISGNIWPQILSRYALSSHYGDFMVADVESPTRFGIEGKWFWDSDYTRVEKNVGDLGHKSLANLMRVLRLSNPYTLGSFFHEAWLEQTQMNIPILIGMSLFLNEYCQKHKRQRLLFSARDCCHLIEIFKKLYPQYESIYFYSSRIIFKNPSFHYFKYVNSLYTDDTVVVDGHASGLSGRSFFKRYFPGKLHLKAIVGIGKGWRHGVMHGRHDQIELLNYASEGSLVDYNEHGKVLLPIEYDPVYVQPAYACIDKCVSLLEHYRFGAYDQKLMDYLHQELKPFVSVLYRHVYHQSKHFKTIKKD